MLTEILNEERATGIQPDLSTVFFNEENFGFWPDLTSIFVNSLELKRTLLSETWWKHQNIKAQLVPGPILTGPSSFFLVSC